MNVKGILVEGLDGKEYLVGTGPEPAADSGNAQPSGVAARPGGYHSKKPAKRHRQYASNSALMRRSCRDKGSSPDLAG
jgi:hypothetical protein